MRATAIVVAALTAITVGSACDSTTGNDSTPLTLLLTDAPSATITEAVVTISSIYLQGGEADGESGRVTLMSTPITTDLLTLKDNIENIVDAVEVPSAVYGELRFVIDGAYITVDDGTGPTGLKTYATPDYPTPGPVDGELLCPSCSQSGLKVGLDGALELTGTAKTLLVDFSVEDSFGQMAGTSGTWVMTPSIKAAPFEPPAT